MKFYEVVTSCDGYSGVYRFSTAEAAIEWVEEYSKDCDGYADFSGEVDTESPNFFNGDVEDE